MSDVIQHMLGGPPSSAKNSSLNVWRLMQSTPGAVIPIVYGTQRITVNWLWAGDYGASGTGGGKAAVTFGKSGSGVQYRIGAVLALCSGAGLGVFTNNNIGVLRAWESGGGNQMITAFGVSRQWIPFGGQNGQAPWGYLVTNHPEAALGFSGIGYVATSAWNLGSSPNPPQISFEVVGLGAIQGLNIFAFGAANNDADMSQVFIDMWVNSEIGLQGDGSLIGTSYQNGPAWGAGFPFSNTPLSEWAVFIGAAGMWCSPLLDRQQPTSRWFQDFLDITQSEMIVTCEAIYIRPYDTAVVSGTTANLFFQTYTYTPNLTPLVDLTDDDFVVQDSGGEPPIKVTRQLPQDKYNEVKIEYVDRNNNYNVGILHTKLQTEIDLFTYRPAQVQRLHHITRQDVAMKTAVMMLYKLTQDVNRYEFTLHRGYIWLDPMDIVTINDPAMGLVQYPVRILKIEEDAEFNLKFTCGDIWTCAPDNFSTQVSTARSGQNAGKGIQSSVNTPVFIEPPAGLTNGTIQVWMGVSNPDSLYGGCGVWVSYDNGTSYTRVGATQGSNPEGFLSAALPSASGFDSSNTLSVNVSEAGSSAQLDTISAAAAAALNNLCVVDKELLSFTDASLVGAGLYNLTLLYRGAYHTTPAAHPTGTSFANLTAGGAVAPGVFHLVLTPAQTTSSIIGKTLYFKFTPFNLEGQQEADISSATAYPYTITGAGLNPVDLSFNFSGVPSANQTVSVNITQAGLILPSGLPGSIGTAAVAATGSTVFSILVNGVVKGTMTFAASATTATFSFSSGISVNVGDVVAVKAPGTPDATLANISVTLQLVLL